MEKTLWTRFKNKGNATLVLQDLVSEIRKSSMGNPLYQSYIFVEKAIVIVSM